DHIGGDLCRDQAAPDDVLKAHDSSFAARKDEIVLPLGACEPPLSQGFQDVRPERDGPLSGFRFRLTDRVVSVSALADMQLASFEVDILPSQSPRLAGA